MPSNASAAPLSGYMAPVPEKYTSLLRLFSRESLFLGCLGFSSVVAQY